MYFSSAPVPGIESTCCKAAMARSGSPICAATRAKVSIGAPPVTTSFSIGSHGYPPFRQSQRRRFVAKGHIGQREISNEIIIFRLLPEERFQFAARLAPTFLGGGMIAVKLSFPIAPAPRSIPDRRSLVAKPLVYADGLRANSKLS